MIRTIVLDSSPLGMICHPNSRGEARLCQDWIRAAELNGLRIVVPEVTNYEVRRELIRARRKKAIGILDDLRNKYSFLRLDSVQMFLAADLWAQVRRLGLPTAGPESLDADAILAAQALSPNDPHVVVATSNPTHLRRFVQAEEWRQIPTS